MAFLPMLQSLLQSAGIHVNIQSFLLLFFLIVARLIAALSLAPFMGGQALPSQAKMGLAAVIAALLYPGLAKASGPIPGSSMFYFALLAKEFVVGMMIGFISQMIFFGVQIAGIVIDTQRGLNQITYLAPQLPGNVSALGNLQVQASIVLFLLLGGHLLFLRSIAHSFLVIPLLQVPHFGSGWLPLANGFTRISASAILVGAQLCAPVVLTIFLVDISFGSIQKVASSIRISSDSNIAKSWIGLAVFLLSAGFFFDRLQQFLASVIPTINYFVASMR
ncbi:flagellar biosynthetic protein FliR [Edaphobacter aggregans]|uniref:flagellar biosynthetic protein FliR n=1 Tax=Edaphobacter aggregans TaxID=570835 RepID=UPI0005586D5A|nr:flagellar biosynthetic protein FliR [Edaphobacter aggregans]